MSTRCNIIVKSNGKWERDIQIYRHGDGYPDGPGGVVNELSQALEYAWGTPRFESGDFSAAIVRAWKEHGGNIDIDGSPVELEMIHGDIEWLYIIKATASDHNPVLEVYKAGEYAIPVWTGHIGDEYTVKTCPHCGEVVD